MNTWRPSKRRAGRYKSKWLAVTMSDVAADLKLAPLCCCWVDAELLELLLPGESCSRCWWGGHSRSLSVTSSSDCCSARFFDFFRLMRVHIETRLLISSNTKAVDGPWPTTPYSQHACIIQQALPIGSILKLVIHRKEERYVRRPTSHPASSKK